MAGAYCNYCGHRCFVLRVIPDGPQKGWEGHLATCERGMANDLAKTGYTHETAVNPILEPDQAAAIHGSEPVVYPLAEGWVLTKRTTPLPVPVPCDESEDGRDAT